MEWNGMEWNGMEWNGMEAKGKSYLSQGVLRADVLPRFAPAGSAHHVTPELLPGSEEAARTKWSVKTHLPVEARVPSGKQKHASIVSQRVMGATPQHGKACTTPML
jgi:hypothetical protein